MEVIVLRNSNSNNSNIRLMSKFGFKDEDFLKLIVGVVNHVTICLDRLTIDAAIDFCRQQEFRWKTRQ
jgi:hypothetical protein